MALNSYTTRDSSKGDKFGEIRNGTTFEKFSYLEFSGRSYNMNLKYVDVSQTGKDHHI